MENSSFQKAADLPQRVREALEALLGRTLQPDESVSVRAYRRKAAPEGEARETAYRRLFERADRTAERVKNIPDSEIDAAIEEGADFVRHHPE
jgi:hypothetical protein